MGLIVCPPAWALNMKGRIDPVNVSKQSCTAIFIARNTYASRSMPNQACCHTDALVKNELHEDKFRPSVYHQKGSFETLFFHSFVAIRNEFFNDNIHLLLVERLRKKAGSVTIRIHFVVGRRGGCKKYHRNLLISVDFSQQH